MKYILTLIIFLVPQFGFAKGKEVYKKTQQVSFENQDIDGVVRSPDGAYISQKKGIKFLPLYKVEKSLDKEIKSSVEYLR